jgi:CheY-like chemotaxis protein
MRILLVEDNPDHVELIRRGLAQGSARSSLTVLHDGQAALDYLLRRGEWSDPHRSPRPDLILLDLRLPKRDGFQVLEEVKGSESLRHIPILILSSSDAASDIVRADGSHANSYLVKPSDFPRFVALASELEDYWLEWSRLPPPSGVVH